MSVFRDFFVKEKPVFTGIARGLGGVGFGGGAADSGGGGFSASGGTVDALYDSSSQFAYHTFISPGTLTVTAVSYTHLTLPTKRIV